MIILVQVPAPETNVGTILVLFCQCSLTRGNAAVSGGKLA